MKNYSVYSLASLIIHEQTHATIFIKNQIQFDEELATFIGNEGALQFIREKYGADSDYYRSLMLYRKDLGDFLRLIHDLYDELNAVYEGDNSREYKLKKKEEVIHRFKKQAISTYSRIFTTESFRRIENIEINNAYILSVERYTQDLSLYRDLYTLLGSDLKRMIRLLKPIKDYRGDPKEYIRELLSAE